MTPFIYNFKKGRTIISTDRKQISGDQRSGVGGRALITEMPWEPLGMVEMFYYESGEMAMYDRQLN